MNCIPLASVIALTVLRDVRRAVWGFFAVSISQAVTPLRMIFWGGLLCILDISYSTSTSINGQLTSGFRFDFLNDFAGMLLITIGVSRLSRFAVDASFDVYMRFVFVCCILNSIEAFLDHFIFERPTGLSVILYLASLASLVATVLFCTSMHILAETYQLSRSANSWLTTRLLVIVFWAIPFGLLNLLFLGALITGQSFHWNIGILILPVLCAMAIPLVHLFISTSRMKSEAQLAADNFVAE